MRRVLDHYLNEWRSDPSRKSLLIRGARQVGKTFTTRQFGESFASSVEINFEKNPEYGSVFDRNLDPRRIIRDLALMCNQPIEPGRTLLFLDEIQQAPHALTALRYFSEEMPELHVIAAGSLIDFVIEEIGIPVGRVDSFALYPMSFVEFLSAKGKALSIEALMQHDCHQRLPEAVHQILLGDVAEYLAIGGMPEAVQEWIRYGDLKRCSRVHLRLGETYRQDFMKYSKKHQVKYVDLLFDEVPRFLGEKFVFSRLRGNWRRRELQPALDLLVKARVVHPVCQTAATGLPLGAEADPERFKTLFLDVGLAESILGFDGSQWILDPIATFVNAGALVESYVGQELLAYFPAHLSARLHYWHRESRSSNAEVDYVIPAGDMVLPLEVKSGATGHLKSMRIFLDSKKETSSYGVRFSSHNFSVLSDLHSYPLYAVCLLAASLNKEVRNGIQSLL